jgi:2-methylisocitrate lyase-like PEP mutase family enzyme
MAGGGTIAERGFPHVRWLTMSAMVTNAPDIADAVQIPTICDADTCSGNPRNMQRTGQVYAERIGTRWGVAGRLGLEHVTDGIVW